MKLGYRVVQASWFCDGKTMSSSTTTTANQLDDSDV